MLLDRDAADCLLLAEVRLAIATLVSVARNFVARSPASGLLVETNIGHSFLLTFARLSVARLASMRLSVARFSVALLPIVRFASAISYARRRSSISVRTNKRDSRLKACWTRSVSILSSSPVLKFPKPFSTPFKYLFLFLARLLSVDWGTLNCFAARCHLISFRWTASMAWRMLLFCPCLSLTFSFIMCNHFVFLKYL